MSYYLQFFGPLKNEYVDWPAGSVSVYRITGDDIAERIVIRNGVVTERLPWPGFLGAFRTMADAVAAIDADRQKSTP